MSSHDFKLVYVDGNPPHQDQTLSLKCKLAKGFHLIRTEYISFPKLSPRNLRFSLQVWYSSMLFFVDNDLSVQRGWLENLCNGADETAG